MQFFMFLFFSGEGGGDEEELLGFQIFHHLLYMSNEKKANHRKRAYTCITPLKWRSGGQKRVVFRDIDFSSRKFR